MLILGCISLAFAGVDRLLEQELKVPCGNLNVFQMTFPQDKETAWSGKTMLFLYLLLYLNLQNGS